jgi:hypothetical protein
VEETVPVVTDQVTVWFEEFATAAVNATVPADCTVAVAGVTVTTTAGETVIWKVCDPSILLESVTLTPKLKVPVVVGVPETIPLVVPRESPAGTCPEEIAKV